MQTTLNDYTRKALILKFAPPKPAGSKGRARRRKIYERVIVLP